MCVCVLHECVLHEYVVCLMSEVCVCVCALKLSETTNDCCIGTVEGLVTGVHSDVHTYLHVNETPYLIGIRFGSLVQLLLSSLCCALSLLQQHTLSLKIYLCSNLAVVC